MIQYYGICAKNVAKLDGNCLNITLKVTEAPITR